MDKAPEPVENDTIGSLFAGIERIVRDAESERDRWSHIAATIRVNAIHHGATDADVDAMIRGEKNFISFVADIVDARAKPRPYVSPPGTLDVAEIIGAVEIGGEAYVPVVEHMDVLRRCRELEVENESLRADLEDAFARGASFGQRTLKDAGKLAAIAPFTDPKP